MNKQDIFPWIKTYETGVEEIDNQHKNLVQLINNVCNEVCDAMLSQEGVVDIINESLNELVNYTIYHFEYEENEYKRYFKNEEIFKKHMERHKELISTATQFKTRFDIRSDDFEIEKFVSTLVLWLSNHILTEDMMMFSIISNLDSGISFEYSVRLAEAEKHGSKGQLAETIAAMMRVSTALSMNLRREIIARTKAQKELTEEILVRKEAERKLKHLAQHDALTGLPNRRLFEELGGAALRLAKRNQYEQAVLFVDIDRFKFVNDTLGHKAGDALLISIARRLEDCVRDSDIVARIGGDEFTIHLGGECSENDAITMASKIIASISVPFELVEGTANVGASVGISLYPSDAKEVETLVQNADAAMYAAKKSGKNAYNLFNECCLENAKTISAPTVLETSA